MKTAEPKEISIILPAHNEALQIEKCVHEVDHAVSSISTSYEIIVSEDGSTDGTDKIVNDLVSNIPNLTLLHSPFRLGKGMAIKKALKQSNGGVVVFMDVDLATSLASLPRILEEVEVHGGLAIGSRHIVGSRVRRRLSRTLSSLAYNMFVRILFLDGVHDHQCGFKAMRRNVTEIMSSIRSNGFFFDTEMILRCKRCGFPVNEVEVEWSEKRTRSTSKVRLLDDGIGLALDLLRYRLSPGKSCP